MDFEINFNRYTSPRDPADIESDIRVVEKDIVWMVAEVSGSGDGQSMSAHMDNCRRFRRIVCGMSLEFLPGDSEC